MGNNIDEKNDIDEYNRAYAEINLGAAEKNVMTAKNALPEGTGIIAVVKTDAYGHGAVSFAKAINHLVAGYAVATLAEAVELREAGIKSHVLILGYISPREYKEAIENGIIVCVSSYEQAAGLSELAGMLGKKALCHVKIDTGMNRIGLPAKRESDIGPTADIISRIKKLPNLECNGIFMHFATMDEADKTKAIRQYDCFCLLLKELETRGIHFTYRHCSNSAAIMEMPELSFEWVRQGITLYGLRPSDEVRKDMKLYPVMELKSHIVHIKKVYPGDGISYGGDYVATEQRLIATVSAGYGDGYPRGLSNKGFVLVRGRRAPIVGRVCMDQFMIDITDIPDVKVEDVVTLVGRDGDEVITVEELGAICGRFNYEFVCDINKRVKRIYKK